MNISLTDHFILFLEGIFGAATGTPSFRIIGLITIGSLFLAAWCVANVVCSNRKGPVVSFFSQLIPGVAVVFAWIIFDHQVAPQIESPGFQILTVIGGTMLVGVLASYLISKKLLGISFSGSVVSNVLTYACVAGAILLGGALVRDMDSSLTNLSQQKHLREENTHSILRSDPSNSIPSTN